MQPLPWKRGRTHAAFRAPTKYKMLRPTIQLVGAYMYATLVLAKSFKKSEINSQCSTIFSISIFYVPLYERNKVQSTVENHAFLLHICSPVEVAGHVAEGDFELIKRWGILITLHTFQN